MKSEIDCKPLPYDNVDNGQTNGHAGGPADGKRVKEERKVKAEIEKIFDCDYTSMCLDNG